MKKTLAVLVMLALAFAVVGCMGDISGMTVEEESAEHTHDPNGQCDCIEWLKAHVPHVVGGTEEYARSLFDAYEIKFEIVYEENNASNGTVIAQTPEYGTEVQDDTVVTLTVSLGTFESSALTKVPLVVGQAEAYAKRAIAAAGLEIEVIYTADTARKGIVILQDPGPSAMIETVSKVTIMVSTGTE